MRLRHAREERITGEHTPLGCGPLPLVQNGAPDRPGALITEVVFAGKCVVDVLEETMDVLFFVPVAKTLAKILRGKQNMSPNPSKMGQPGCIASLKRAL